MKTLRHTAGYLLTRPTQPTINATPRGLYTLQLETQRDGLVYVPSSYQPDKLAPLVLMLHGAGGDAWAALALLEGLADRYGLLLLAVASQGQTWDMIVRDFGPDIAVIDQALAYVFNHYTVDPQRIAIAGFSDGASYALSTGLTNGNLFTHIMAFSPGFMAPADQQGHPKLFVSHGTHDSILLVDRCSRRIVPQLQQAGL